MWGSLLVLALPITLNPGLLGIILLLISRPRPVQSLLAYWVGCLIGNIPLLLAPLLMMHLSPTFSTIAEDLGRPAMVGGSTVRPLQIGIGVVALLVAALISVRFRARERANLPTPGGRTSTLVLDSNTPTASPRWLARGHEVVAGGRSAIRRLIGRAYNAWENGSAWVALVFGMIPLPGPPLILFVATTVVASGASIGTQVLAAIAFVVVMLAVVEIALVSCLVAPAKTEAVLRPVHDWVLAHRWEVLIAILAVAGFWQLVTGVGIV